MKPSRPKRVPRKKPAKVEPPKQTEETDNAVPSKYSTQPKIGEPTIGVDPDKVERVGLGNLKVIDNGRNTYL